MNLSDAEEYANEIAAKRADKRTPAVVRRAFLDPVCRLTLRGYFALEEMNSPLVTMGEWPWNDAAAMRQLFCGSYAVLFPDRKTPAPDQLVEALNDMIAEVNRGFSTMMSMRTPTMPGQSPSLPRNNGIGWQALLIASALKAGIWEPLDLPLDQLFILAASNDFLDGMECRGEDYRDRSLSAQQEAA